MSYDVGWSVPKCERCGQESRDTDWNYTSNCAAMWRAAGCDIAEFHGKPVGECIVVLREGIAALKREPERYRAMNPANGWGGYDTLVPRLEALLEMYEAAPRLAIGWVSR